MDFESKKTFSGQKMVKKAIFSQKFLPRPKNGVYGQNRLFLAKMAVL